MKKIGSHFRFNRQERSGIFYLLCLVFAFQLIFFLSDQWDTGSTAPNFVADTRFQDLIDSLHAEEVKKGFERTKPFNPNFISDFKGYVLGMSPEEIDRLHQFRSGGKYVNSAQEFQEVTRVEDSLLNVITPHFRFPEWRNLSKINPVVTSSVSKEDLNAVRREELIQIRGVGEVLSGRILKFRDALGGFLEDDQLKDVYGLDEEVADRVLLRYTVVRKPDIELLDLNKATEDELSGLVYISAFTARHIVRYRDTVGVIDSLGELQNIPGFPSDKITRIKLYLTL